jgi:hypothetical protein
MPSQEQKEERNAVIILLLFTLRKELHKSPKTSAIFFLWRISSIKSAFTSVGTVWIVAVLST